MYTIILHVANSAPVKVEVEDLPNPTDTSILGHNPRERNDKEFDWLDEGVQSVIFPWWRINYVQILPNEDDVADFPLPFRD